MNTANTPDELWRYAEQSALPITDDMLLTIGQRTHPTPKPFPLRFVEKFAATVAEHPVVIGRLVVHTVRACESGEAVSDG